MSEEHLNSHPDIHPAGIPNEIIEIDRKISELQRIRMEKTSLASSKIVEVTCVMPVYNAWLWLGRALFSLEIGAQSVPLHIILCDDSSDDPCADILGGPGFERWAAGRAFGGKVSVLPQASRIYEDENGPITDPEVRKNRNIDHMYMLLTRVVETPYILYLDSDVGMPSGGVAAMLEHLKTHPDVGMIGIRYDQHLDLDHVQFGCAMARTKIMREDIVFNSRATGCVCRAVTAQMKSLGHGVGYLPGWVARHFKHEMP